MAEERRYLLTFNPDLADREAVKEALNGVAEVQDWFLFMPGAFAVATRGTRRQLHGELRRRLPDLHFILTRLKPGGYSGFGPKALWRFVKGEERSDA